MNPLQQGLCFAIETGLNQLLPFDLDYQRKWSGMDGKTIAVKVTDWDSRFCVHYQNQVFSVTADETLDADVTLTATSFELFKVALESRDNEAAAMNSNIHFEGQVNLGQAFAASLQSVEIDWEEVLSEPLGDILARRTHQIISSGLTHLQAILTTGRDNFKEYVQEEARLTPTHIEVENFVSDLRHLRTDVDRLAAKIQQLALMESDSER